MNDRNRRHWTDSEVQVLCKRYPLALNRVIGDELGRTASAVSHKAQRLGLRKATGYRRQWTERDVELLRKRYPVASNRLVAEELGRSEEVVAAHAAVLGLRKDEPRATVSSGHWRPYQYANVANNACVANGCGLLPRDPQHDRYSRQFTHEYLGARSARRKALRAKAPALCAACASGKHNGRHTSYGCIETVDKPDGFVCKCKDEMCRMNMAPRLSIRHSDSYGMTFVQFGAGL